MDCVGVGGSGCAEVEYVGDFYPTIQNSEFEQPFYKNSSP